MNANGWTRVGRWPVVWVAFAVGLVAARSEDWPRFLGVRGDGTSLETNLVSGWGTNGPTVLWSRKIGPGYSAPSVRGDRLVVHHREGNEEVVEAFDGRDGKPEWRHAYPTRYQDPYGYNNGPRCTPLLTEDRCYTFGAEGKLVCVELGTGKRVWMRDTATDWQVPEAFFGVGSTPLLEGNRLIVMVGGQPEAGMVGLDAATGRTVWETVGATTWTGRPMVGWPGERTVVWKRWDKQASYSTPVAATIHGKRRVFCLMRQGLVMLDPATGAVDDAYWFRAQVEDSVNAINPVVSGDRVFISGAYYRVGSVVLRVTPEFRFEPVWRGTALEIHWTTPILHQGHLYAFSGRNEPDARFRCVEFGSGAVKWDRDESWGKSSTKTPAMFGRGSAVLADGKLIALGEGGLLGLFRPNAERVEELARWQVPGLHYPCWAAPVLSGGRLYLRGEDLLVCVGLRPR